MLIIQGGYVMDPIRKLEGAYDLCICDGIIVEMREAGYCDRFDTLYPHAEMIDATGCIVSPGFIDVHVHFRDPGFTYKEDIESGARAAAAGGFTTVVMMANTSPVVDSPEVVEGILQKTVNTPIHVLVSATATQGMKGLESSDWQALIAAGVAGFTDDGLPILQESVMKELLLASARYEVPFSLHEEDATMIAQSGIHAGEVALEMGLTGASREAEIAIIARDLALIRQGKDEGIANMGVKVNFQHISTREAVAMIRKAKADGIQVYAEVSPHHISMTQEDVRSHGTLAKMNPPLRTNEDRLALIEGLCDNTIDLLATDHAPHSREEKEKDFLAAPSGIIGLETAFSVYHTTLVCSGAMPMMQMLEKMTAAPARLYNLERKSVSVGNYADLVVFDPKAEYCPGPEYQSKSRNTPFTGRKLQGEIRATICRGEVVYRKEV